MNHEDQVERLKKVYALALEGSDGEKQAATELLAKLCDKYHVSENELSNASVQKFQVEYHGQEQLQLLFQVVYKVTNEKNRVYSIYNVETHRSCKTKVLVSCTKAQIVDIRMLFDYYTQLFNEEKEFFLRAFVQKHGLFGERKPGEGHKHLSADDYGKMANFMNGMRDASLLKQIERGK